MILKIERRKMLFTHCPPLAFNKISVTDSNHLYKKLPQYYKKKIPRSYRVCPTLKRKREKKNPNLCQISQDQELKKNKKPQLSQK